MSTHGDDGSGVEQQQVGARAEGDVVVIDLDGADCALTVEDAVALSFLIMEACNEVDTPATDAAVKAQLQLAQEQLDAEAPKCEFGHPIEGDCATCDTPICNAESCDSHCEHV